MSKLLKIKIPNYTIGEELMNAISHGVGAVFGIVALVLMVNKAEGAKAETTVALFGSAIIITYTISCIYHALPRDLLGKKVMRVVDHCTVFLLVYGTYIPISLLGVGGKTGWLLFGFVGLVTLIGIVLTIIDIDKFNYPTIICHLLDGWSIVFAISHLINSLGKEGFIFLIVGGVAYSLGSILYAVGKKIRYIHGVFHIFTILGTFFHFWVVYMYLL